MQKKGYVFMKREMIEKAVNELDLEIIEKNLDASGIRRRNLLKRATILAAAAAVLITAGIFVKNNMITKDPSGTEKQTGNETEQGAKNPRQAVPSANYSIALAKYPEIPNIAELLKIREEIRALKDSGLDGEEKAAQEVRLLREYEAYKETVQKELEKVRGSSTAANYSEALEAYTKKTADRILSERGSGNVVYSPANLYLALCMLSEAAGNESRDELLALTGLGNVEKAREAADVIWRSLYRDDASGKTWLANSLWLNEKLPFNKDTVALITAWYYADVYSAPMGKDGTDAALKEWINMRTGHLMQNAAEQLETAEDTALLLVSSLYYSDNWWNGFNSEATTEALFTPATGNAIPAAFMHSSTVGSYYREDGSYILAALSMESGASMVFLLPDESTTLQELIEQGRVTEGLLRWQDKDSFSAAVIQWSVPKFDVESELSMTDTLRALGVQRIFGASADFSPLTGRETDRTYSVTKIQHAARVKINEEGCAAAAYTVIEIADVGYPAKPEETLAMNLNRPFAFMITGVDGLPLFIGVVNEV